MITIQSLHIYPLKSAQGIDLDEMTITEAGPAFDRQWMVVDKNFRFLSQRTHPQMSQIKTCLNGNQLILSADNLPEVKVEKSSESLSLPVKIFGQETEAISCNSEAADWISKFLGTEATIVESPQYPSRFTSGKHGPKKEVRFSDGYPFLLTNQSSLDKLNGKLPTPVEMRRFRPNIVVSGAEADSEDDWQKFSIGSLTFDAIKACTRCSIIDVDPNSGASGKDVGKTLKTYRTREDGQIIFGQNLIHEGVGEIKVGDQVIAKS